MTDAVRGVDNLQLDGGVVVGDDGSAGAEGAIRYAIEEAERRGGDLHVVRAWTVADAVRPPDEPFGYVPSYRELEIATRAATQEGVDRLLGEHPDVSVHVHVVHGQAAEVLVAASTRSDIVVVGSRGLGKVASLLLGSVAQEVVRDSAGPVVVVR